MSLLNVSHVKVWGHLVSGNSTSKPSEIIVAPDGSLVLSAPSESGKSHRLDLLNWTTDDLHSQVQKALQGLNVCVLKLSIGENGNPGEFVKSYRTVLQHLFTGRNKIGSEVTVSYSVLGINDISCIDLVDFSKVEDGDLSKTLRPAASFNELVSAIPSEVTLPTFMLINVQRQTAQGTTNGSLILGDIGGTCLSTTSPAALDRSISRINSVLLEMDQPYTDSQIDMTENRLSILLQNFINGNGELTVCADLVQNGSIKALISGFLFLENLRKVRNYPQINYVDENIKRLADLETMNGTLEQDKRQAQKDIRDLRKSLDHLDGERRKLQNELKLMKCGTETERFEKEYLAATMELQCLDLKDKLRKCEIELISLDELNLRLKLEKYYLMEERAQQEKSRKEQETAQVAHASSQQKQIEALGSKLAEASLCLDSSRREADQLKQEISQANSQIHTLTENLQKATLEHTQLKEKTANSPTKPLQEKEIFSLKRQLESTKQTEERLTEMLKRNEDRAEDHRRLMMDLERQLGDLRAENARLAALNSVSKTPIIVQQPPPPTNDNNIEFRQLKQQTQELHTVLKELSDTFSQKRKQEMPTMVEKKPRTYVRRPMAESYVIPSPTMMDIDPEDVPIRHPQTVGDLLPKVMNTLPPEVKQVVSQIKATMPEPPPKPITRKPAIRKRKEQTVTSTQEEPVAATSAPISFLKNTLTKKETTESIKKETNEHIKKEEKAVVSMMKEPKVVVAPDSPSKYKPSSFKPTLPIVTTNNENLTTGANLTQRLFSKDMQQKKLKIPDKPQLMDLPIGNFRSKTNIGGADIDSTALNNIISNMSVTMPPPNTKK